MTAKSCRKPKTNNQQLLRSNSKLELKYEVNIRFETQIWKPGPDLKMKNLEMRSWIPGLNLEKNRLKPGNGHFLVYFNKSIGLTLIMMPASFILLGLTSLYLSFSTCYFWQFFDCKFSLLFYRHACRTPISRISTKTSWRNKQQKNFTPKKTLSFKRFVKN